MKKPRQIEMTTMEIESLMKRVEHRSLKSGDYGRIKEIIETFIYLGQAVDDKSRSVSKLLSMIFGSKTEKAKNILGNSGGTEGSEEGEKPEKSQEPKKKRKGHGRNGAADYKGAERIRVPLSGLSSGQRCPLCVKGKLYSVKEPSVIVRVSGNAPLKAKVFELEKVRCNLCGEVFTAEAPEEAKGEKYDEKATAITALLKYGSGFPFNRLENLQSSLGIPLPASTQWDIVKGGADKLSAVFEELIRQAAQGEIIHNDDTTMKILALMKEQRQDERTGVFTTGILSITGERKIGLFYTSTKHSGENMADLLSRRQAGLSPPIQMCDALSRNITKEFETLLANCMTHGRRNFVEIVGNFPQQCRYVIETLAEVYKNDKIAKESNMTKEQRLIFHKSNSGTLMKELHDWLNKEMDEKNNDRVEPNSGLGRAIKYML